MKCTQTGCLICFWSDSVCSDRHLFPLTFCIQESFHMTLMPPGDWHFRYFWATVSEQKQCLTPFLFLFSNQMNIEMGLPMVLMTKNVFQVAYFLLLLFSILQLLIQSTYCCEQYAYNRDTLLYNYIMPWALNLLLIHLYIVHIFDVSIIHKVQALSSHFDASSAALRSVSQSSMLVLILQNVTGCSRTYWYFWYTALTYCVYWYILNMFLTY